MGGFGDFLFGSGGQDPQAFRAPGYEQQGQLLNMLALGGAITPEQIAQQRSQLQSRIDASPAPEVPSFVPTPYSKEDILAGMGQQGTFDGAQQFGSQLAPDFQGQMDFLNSLEDASKFGPGGGQPLQELGVLNTKDLDPLQALSFQQRNPFQFDFQGPDTVNFDPRQAVGDAFTPFAERIQSQIGRFGQRQDADLMEDLNRRGLLTAGAGTEALGRARETRGDQLSEALLGLSGQQAQQQLGASQFGAGLQAQQAQQRAQSQQARQLSQAQELFRQQGASDAQAQALAANALQRRQSQLGAQAQQFQQQGFGRQQQLAERQQPFSNLMNLFQLSSGATPGSQGSPGFLGPTLGAFAGGAGTALGGSLF